MASLPAEIVTAVALFAGTNVDDVVVLSLLSASSRAGGQPRRWEIWAGQYAGFAVLVGLSAAAGRGLALVPERWLWLLALIPFTVGVVSLVAAIRAVRRGAPPRPPSAGGLPGVVALTIVNGADNLAAYTPFFAATAGSGRGHARGFRCRSRGLVLGGWPANAPRSGDLDHQQVSHWILPAAFILIGLYVLHETNAPIRL